MLRLASIQTIRYWDVASLVKPSNLAAAITLAENNPRLEQFLRWLIRTHGADMPENYLTEAKAIFEAMQ